MKKISQQQAEFIVAATNEGLTNFPPAALEKDILLTEILSSLRNEIHQEKQLLRPIFGGGTSLIKANPIISRMSEDLDFKIIEVNQGDIARSQLRVLRESCKQLFEADGFSIVSTDSRNSTRYFNFNLEYESKFEASTSLRPHIQLEFTVSKVIATPQERMIETLLYRDSKIENPYQFEFACVDYTQTAAEKLVGLLKKVDEVQSGENNRLIRHVYDLHQLKKFGLGIAALKSAVISAINEDYERFGETIPKELRDNPVTYLLNSIKELSEVNDLDAIYDSFVGDLVSGEKVPLDEALESVIYLVSNI